MADLFDRILLLKESNIFAKVATDDLRYVAQALEEDVDDAVDGIGAPDRCAGSANHLDPLDQVELEGTAASGTSTDFQAASSAS